VAIDGVRAIELALRVDDDEPLARGVDAALAPGQVGARTFCGRTIDPRERIGAEARVVIARGRLAARLHGGLRACVFDGGHRRAQLALRRVVVRRVCGVEHHALGRRHGGPV
jgi:hypothetical protein